MMRLYIAVVSTIAMACSFPAGAQNTTGSVSLFVSGLRTDASVEDFSSSPSREVRAREGAFGIGLERRINPVTTVELSGEHRRDIVVAILASRCGYYQNTCFLRHRFEIWSTPVVLLARFSPPTRSRLAVFGSVGARYVAKPSAEDVSGGSLFSYDTKERISGEVGGGVALRVTGRLSLFADGRFLTGRGAQWDPRRRLNLGVRVRY